MDATQDWIHVRWKFMTPMLSMKVGGGGANFSITGYTVHI